MRAIALGGVGFALCLYVASPWAQGPSVTPATDASRAPSTSAGQATALLVSATNAPLRVAGTDGRDHLEYDLLITNVFTAPVTVTAVDVTAADGRLLLRLAGRALSAQTEPIFYPTTEATPLSPIPAGGSVAIVIDLVVPRGEAPTRIGHHVAYEFPADAPAAALIAGRALAGPDVGVDPRTALEIAPPLRGGGWLNGNGCCDAFSVHRSPRVVVDGARFVKPETFAIDWLRLRDGRRWTGDGTRNEQYFAFGADVVAVGDGIVVSVRDDMPDETPHEAPVAVKGPADFLGNHVVVRMRSDVWAVYAHLQSGSAALRAGDRVRTGQRVGRLGNSGNSSEAHLHFQLSDGPEALTATSLPFTFDRYTLVGTVDPAQTGAPAADSKASPTLRIVGVPRPETGTYPLVLTVQEFR